MANDIPSDTDSSSDESSTRRQILTAVDQGNFELLKKLFDKSNKSQMVNIIDQGDYNNSLLHIAIKRRKRKILHEQNTKIIQFLVEKGADIRTKNIRNETALDLYKRRFGNVDGDKEWDKIFRLLCPIPPSKMFSTITKSDSSSLVHLDRDVEIYKGNPTYEANGALKLSAHGIVFQLQLLMLFLLKAMKNYKDVTLGTEIVSAGKFDDVTLRYRKNSSKSICWRFLQAKHLRNAKIGVDDLFTTVNDNNNNTKHRDNNYKNKTTQENKHQQDVKSDRDTNKNDNKNKKKKREDFSLYKYFNSFCTTLDKTCYKNVILEEFTICTNADFSDKLVSETYFEEDVDFKNDVILYLGKGEMQKFKLNNISKEIIQKEVNESKSKYSDYLTAFIEKFRLVVKYPDQRGMSRVNVDELRIYFGLLDSKFAFHSLKYYMLNWFMNFNANKSKFLRGEDGVEFLKIIKANASHSITGWESKKYIDELTGLNIQFTDTTLSKFLTENIQREETSQLICISTNSPLLTSIKMNQYAQNNENYKTEDSKIFLPFSKILQSEGLRDVILNSFANEDIFNLIILNCELANEFNTDAITKICEKLSKSLKKSKDVKSKISKKIILIDAHQNQIINEFIKYFKNSKIKFEITVDETSFAHLSEQSKDRLLQKCVCFKGSKIPFRELINMECANSVIDSKTLLKLLTNNEVKLDDYSSVKEEEIYINRTLRPQTVDKLILSNKMFLSSNCVVISNASIDDLKKLDANFDNESLFDYNQLKKGIRFLDQTTYFLKLLRRYSEQNMSKDHNMFWLENTAGHLVLKQFTSIAPVKVFINDINNETNDIKIKEEEITEWHKLMENKVNIIAAEPGMGKSSVMSNIGKNLKSAYPEIWVKRVNLNDYAASPKRLPGPTKLNLENINFTEEDTDQAIEFITEMLFSSGTDDELLQKKLFQHVLKEGRGEHGGLNLKIIFLFDGFDEISPTHKYKTLILLKALKNSNMTQMWQNSIRSMTKKHAQQLVCLHLTMYFVEMSLV
ncbi:repetitive organellar protein-like isoform X2 [Euwallacea fornicatus]|uniref:repetitive organellar protein-like isoform X2 n=1 Tax=Euwallacea fornicatus TaxID=995702 RepID=UPI0033903FBA